MKKIVFLNSDELEIADIVQTGGTVQAKIKSSDFDGMLSLFKDNPAATSVIRYYAGTDLICGYKGYTHLKDITMEFGVVSAIDYTTEDPNTDSGFAETHTDIITVRMEKASVPMDTSSLEALSTDVQSLKEDMAAINAALGGE